MSPQWFVAAPLLLATIGLPTAASTREPLPGVDVPLSLWTSASHPSGVALGDALGISWGDYDRDGFVDLFACYSGNLWRNVGGVDWELVADLDDVLPSAYARYGSSFGDYNNDGLPDIGTEPREIHGDVNLNLLENLGGGKFVNVIDDVVDVIPYGDSETICWGDVNGDGYLDMFLPVYPPWASGSLGQGGPGNFFLFNLGPTGGGGAFAFHEMSGSAGLDNPPPDSARPEGAQFVDCDFDGDLDLYSNGYLYQNISNPATPLFQALEEVGIGFETLLDEGAMFFDYDLDGDYDLLVVYTEPGVRIWESYGDGTFFPAELSIVDEPFSGLDLGMSAADWDMDGDIDFTTRQVFRRNMLMEEGARHFTVASHTIPSGHISSATPAWADWDHDGDLDCAIGNFDIPTTAHFYENTTYDATPAAARRHLRVRVLRDSPTVPDGLETEFGASVEVDVITPHDGLKRKKFVASSHGYLNQNDYTLHFALPPDPFPADPARDVAFDVVVDFPGLPEQGLTRIDEHANTALGSIDLATLDDREITVFRSGKVIVDGVETLPAGQGAELQTSTGGLMLADRLTGLPAPVMAPGEDWFVGLEITTGADSLRVKEIILDGQLDARAQCETGHNMAIWDVTTPSEPVLAPGSIRFEETSPRNRRSYFRTDVILAPSRTYRVVAAVTSLRETPIAGPVDEGLLVVRGGLGFTDPDPCSGSAVAAATPSPGVTSVAVRYGAYEGGEVVAVPHAVDATMAARLLDVQPNPFPSRTLLSVFLDVEAEVELRIYDARGRRIRRLSPGRLAAGTHTLEWDGHGGDAALVTPGTYFVELRVNGSRRDVAKAIVVR